MDLFAPSHILLIMLVLVLLFGGKKIPELMKGLGQGVREFKKASSGIGEEPEEKPKLMEKEPEKT
jgi:sec-independent protein translocase protein TatA